jgi:hypothetical protein
MWRGDASEPGSFFREFVITSNQIFSTTGTFQVYGLEGIGGGFKDGKLAASDKEPTVLFDKDFDGLPAAVKELSRLIKEAQQVGFSHVTMMDMLEFEDKRRRSQ